MSDSEPELDLLLGTVIAEKYRVDELVGRGGMGAVYQATNLAIGKRVALKFLFRDAALDRDAVARFQREAEAASAVESAHIVEIFDSGTTADGRPFLVMELLRGEDLRRRLQRRGRLVPDEAVRVGVQVARALRRAHAAGIVHRDLKPDNVFLCERDDDPMFVKLVDFGISKIARRESTATTLTRRGVVLGTAFYMAPEQAQALPDIDGRTDLYSLGAILYEALCGEPPHGGTTYEAILIDVCTKDAPPLRERAPNVPEALAAVVHRALARDRGARFGSADELSAALVAAVPDALSSGANGALAGVSTARSARPPTATGEGTTVPRPATTARGRRRLLVAGAALLLATVAAGTAFVALPGGGGASETPAPNAEPTARPRPTPGPGAVAPPSPEPSAPEPRTVAPPSPAPSASTVSGVARSATPPPASPRPPARHRASPPRAAATAGRAGVAGDLELATEP